MKVIEIFDSIDGEGLHAGGLATFIRLAGCNMACRYCDTKYSWSGGKEMNVDAILEEVKKLRNRNVTLTGGEPLIHKDIRDLIVNLCLRGYMVNVETNGSVDIEPYKLMRNCSFTVDYKLPSAGEHPNAMMDISLWDKLGEGDAIKFVCNKDDFQEIRRVIKYPTRATIILSPIFGEVEPKELVEFAKELRNGRSIDTEKLRVQVQLHKVIWDPEAKGV